MACIKGNEAVVKALVEAGADIHEASKRVSVS